MFGVNINNEKIKHEMRSNKIHKIHSDMRELDVFTCSTGDLKQNIMEPLETISYFCKTTKQLTPAVEFSEDSLRQLQNQIDALKKFGELMKPHLEHRNVTPEPEPTK